MQDLVGKAWGRFLIIEERGRGGMAVVYRAYDNVLQRTVALKVLLPHLAANAEFTQRFEREAITAANLRHPNIVIIYDVGSHESFQYIVMEYLDGPTLHAGDPEDRPSAYRPGYPHSGPIGQCIGLRPSTGPGPPRRQAGERIG